MEIIIDSQKIPIRDATFSENQNGFDRLVEIKDESKIQLHPCEETETIAILPDAIPQQTNTIKALVCTENEHASAIEYAMAIIDIDSDVEARYAISHSEYAVSHSGWHRVEKNEIYVIEVKLPHISKQHYHLVLATRLPDDGHKDYAWARWTDFQFLSSEPTEKAKLVLEQELIKSNQRSYLNSSNLLEEQEQIAESIRFDCRENGYNFCQSDLDISWQSKDKLTLKDRVRLIAFYLPQFHPIPENDRWWGKGFTEWTNVTKAKPLFKDHYQPHLPADLGFYDLRVGEVREEQAKLAQKYGVYGFCYYYYWFAGKRLLHRPVDEMLNSGKPDIPFCLCWANENWTRRWDGAEHDVLIAQDHSQENDTAFAESLVPFLQDNRYIRINGKPLVLIYRADLLPDPNQSVDTWRRVFRKAGIGEVEVCGALTFGLRVHNLEKMGIDSAVQFPPHGVAANLIDPKNLGVNDYQGNIYDFRDVVTHALASPMPKQKKLFLSVMTAWDNTARKGKAGNVFLHANPDIYELWLRGAIEKTQQRYTGDEQLVFINAWNEWAEGTHLEPDRKNGHAYLSATCRAINRTHSIESVLQLLRKLSIESDDHLHRLIDDLEIRIRNLSSSLAAMSDLSNRLKQRELCISKIDNHSLNKDTISYIESPVAQQQFQKSDSFVIAGWVVSKVSKPNAVELCSKGKLISSAFVNFPRPDIVQAYPDFASNQSGFHLVYKVHQVSDLPLEIFVVLEDGSRHAIATINCGIKENFLPVPVKIRKSLQWDRTHEKELSNILTSLRVFPLADNYAELLDELDFILNHRNQTLAALEELISSTNTNDLF